MDAHSSIAASTNRDASPSVAPATRRKTDEARRAAKRDPQINSKALLRPRGRSVSGNARVPQSSDANPCRSPARLKPTEAPTSATPPPPPAQRRPRVAAANWFRYFQRAHLARPKSNRQLYRLVKRAQVCRIVEIGMSDLA